MNGMRASTLPQRDGRWERGRISGLAPTARGSGPKNYVIFVGMTHRTMPHTEIKPLSLMAQDLVYLALRGSSRPD